jgi:hypothetical protein
MHQPAQRHAMAATLLIVLVSGCSSSDDLVLQRSLARQAEQNAQMARHTQQIVETTRQLVESDARARGELIEMQQNLQDGVRTERNSLDRQHEELETERQAIAHQRQRDPLIAAAIVNAGLLLACMAPLLLAYWVLRSSWAQDSGGFDDLLIQELITETSIFLPRSTLALSSVETPPEPAEALAGATQRLRSADE